MTGISSLGGRQNQSVKVRADKGSIRLTERDLAALCWIGEQYAIRLDQLARLLGRDVGRCLAPSTTRAAVSRWVRGGLAKTRKVTVRDQAFVWLTNRGLREVGLDFKFWEPTASSVGHLFWTNQVRLYVQDNHPEPAWLSERHLRRGGTMQTLSVTKSHVADGEVHLPRGIVAVEVELTSKSASRRKAIMELLAQRYATVWYFAPPAVLGGLDQTLSITSVESRQRIRIYPLDRVA